MSFHKKPLINRLAELLWILFFTALVFFIDVKLARYKLIVVEIILIFLAGLWFIKDYKNIPKLINEAAVIPVVALAGFYSAAYFLSPAGAGAYPEWQRIFFSCLAFLLAYRIFYITETKIIINYLIAAGALISIYGILQFSGGIWIVKVPKLGRIFATFGNPNFFASFLVGLIPLTVASFFKDKRLWKGLAVILMIVALYLTKTRGAWLGITFSLLLWYFLYGRKKIPVYTVISAGVLLLLFIYLNRSQLGRGTQRLLIWRDSVKMASDNPLSGVGIGNYHNEFPDYASKKLLKILPRGKFIVNYSHNEFIDFLSETGIPGFGIYLWTLAVVFLINLKSGKRNYIQFGAFFGALSIIVHSSVSVNMRFTVSSIWAFLLLGLSVGDTSGNYSLYNKSLKDSAKKVKIFLAVLFFVILTVWALKTAEPLVSHKKLASEVDFFDKEKEYSKSELLNLLKKDPDNALIYYKLGWIQAKNKEFKKAIKNFKKAVDIDDSLTGAFNNLGNIYFTMGKRSEAAKYYVEALKRNPDMPDAHFNLGYIYYYQGRLKEATREFNTVIKLDPKNYKAKMMLDKMVQ